MGGNDGLERSEELCRRIEDPNALGEDDHVLLSTEMTSEKLEVEEFTM
jgi:hypothetical protein